ncbi:uncharacterized protein RCO7_01143 [Rhynchosporium graminicola]|uniref:Zn(2)-C6 fungal-type domain-containing protein n=1 Tax=Rhynchosporium graminicola TaxID=2792576 RepID=A0A1E1JQR7_9HELO|nr:uncharacterized protein RCO7_01143 [Rhynchosporium commune]
MSSERGSSTQDSYNPNIGVQKHARAELKPPKPGPRLKCSFCRDNKKACEPAEYIWPGENCQGCEKLGLLCSEPSEKPLGRRRKRKASQLDLDPDVPRSSLTPGEMTGTFENSEEYVDWLLKMPAIPPNSIIQRASLSAFLTLSDEPAIVYNSKPFEDEVLSSYQHHVEILSFF